MTNKIAKLWDLRSGDMIQLHMDARDKFYVVFDYNQRDGDPLYQLLAMPTNRVISWEPSNPRIFACEWIISVTRNGEFVWGPRSEV